MHESSWLEAREKVKRSFNPVRVEEVPLSESNLRIIASDISALCDLPAYDTSAMDGWVVNGSAPWKIVGEVATGFIANQELQVWQCMKIATGGVIPKGGEAILPWENAEVDGALVSGAAQTSNHIRPSGAECKNGEVFAKLGTRVTPPLIGLLAATGHDKVKVFTRPRVALFFLGDELIHSGIPKQGTIRDSLGVQFPAILNSHGADIHIAKFIKDDLMLFTSEINEIMGTVDLIITTGGTADGPRDFVKPVIEEFSGKYLLDRVKVRPGYHLLLAEINNGNSQIPFLALPGNPQSALAAFISFGKPILESMSGVAPKAEIYVELTEKISTQSDFAKLIPGVLSVNGFTPAQYLNSAMLRGVASSGGFALIEPGMGDAGSLVRWLAFDF